MSSRPDVESASAARQSRQEAAPPAPVVRPSLRQVLESWRDDPELGVLARRVLLPSSVDTGLSAEAEAAVALHLLERGCALKVERRTPSGRGCDFEVIHGQLRFFVHVKRLRGSGAVHLSAPASLRRLERLERPFVVLWRWMVAAPTRLPAGVLAQAERFLLGAQLGDEAVLSDRQGVAVGRLRIIARGTEPHVTVALALADAPDDRRARILRLLRRAYDQFMPGAENVILVCADAASEHDLETALHGTHIERWDRLPPRGERVAHGRADDGFWSGRRRERSRLIGRFEVASDGRYAPRRLWVRGGSGGGSTDAPGAQTKERVAAIGAIEQLLGGP